MRGVSQEGALCTLRHDDDSLRWLREQFGVGSAVERLAREALVAGAVTDITLYASRADWVSRAEALRAMEPELGALVLPRVRARANRELMAAVGEWLERAAPWLFEEARDGDE